MSGATFTWNGQPIPFRDGQSLAAALDAAGVRDLGSDGLGGRRRVFCAIGACQGCLVRRDGVVVEACLTTATAGAAVTPVTPVDPAEATHG